jgi:hypothetical protein
VPCIRRWGTWHSAKLGLTLSRERKPLTNQPRKCRNDTIIAGIISEKYASSLAPSHSFCSCPTFGEAHARGIGFFNFNTPPAKLAQQRFMTGKGHCGENTYRLHVPADAPAKQFWP